MKKYFLGNVQTPIRWMQPWEYEPWKAAVLKDEELQEPWLEKLYLEQWEPIELYKVLRELRFFGVKPKVKKARVRRTPLDLDNVQKRIARAIWIECGRLILRYQTPEARAYVVTMREQAQRAAGIETF